MHFKGFPTDLQNFLIELSFNNTIQKQSENIIKYRKYITEPLNSLYYDLLPVVTEIHNCLETKPARCISTPYTDRRFSPGTPLKEYMYIRFKQNGKSKDIAGLYFDMGADYYSYGMRIYKQTASGFQEIKDKMKKEAEEAEKLLIHLTANEFEIIGNSYKLNHYPEISNKALNDFLNRKTFCISKSKKINSSVFSSALHREIAEGFYCLKDFVNFII